MLYKERNHLTSKTRSKKLQLNLHFWQQFYTNLQEENWKSVNIKNPSEGVRELTRQWRFAGLRSRTGGQCRKEGPAFFLTIFLLEVQAYLNFLYFSLLQSTDIVLFFFFFFTNWRSMAAQHWVSLSAQFSKQHLPTLNLLSHFGNSHNISNFFSVSIFVMVICDQWSLMLLLQLTEGSDDGEEKCF